MKTKHASRKSVERTIVEMLTENTGIHMLDSSGVSGRAWQRNQNKTLKDFEKEPALSWNADDKYYTISTYHYLKRGLDLDALCEEFNSSCVPAEDWNAEDFYGVSQKGEDWVKAHGFRIEATFNTYNEDSNLSQILQGTWLTLNDESYLILQIHGGCDARGGYTDARLFHVPARYDGALLEDVYGSVTKKDGTTVQVDNLYNGSSLTTENGGEVVIEEGDSVELCLGAA